MPDATVCPCLTRPPAARAARRRGHHCITGLGGEVHWTIDGLGPFSPGIWHFIYFDDGLQCWVPEAQFLIDA